MKKIVIIILLVFVVALVAAFFFINASFSDGFRAGTMVKISKKGYVYKTIEGELNLGNYFTEKGSPSTSIWNFSVDAGADSVMQKLENAVLTGKRVKLHYEERYVQFSWRGDTKYFVYKVVEAP